MKKLLISFFLMGPVLAQGQTGPSFSGAARVAPAPGAVAPLLLATEQLKSRLLLIDPVQKTIVWEWDAPLDPDIPANRQPWFTNPSDAKSTADKTGILFSCSGGAVGCVDVKSRRLRWYFYSGSNPHSITELPDGNTATASSSGNFVKIIPSAGAHGYIDSLRFTRDTLTFAHSAVWADGLLWSAGLREIVAWKYGQPAASLSRALRVPLPDPDGHDLVQTSDSTLLLSTDHNLWTFNLRTHRFSVYTGCVPHVGIKSISFSGALTICVYPNEVWWSDRVYKGDGTVLYQLEKARFYKVRFF